VRSVDVKRGGIIVERVLYFVSFFYFASMLGYGVFIVRSIIKDQEIKIIHCVQLMYTFVYGFLPAYLYWKVASGEEELLYQYYRVNETTGIIIYWLLSLVGFFSINFVYALTSHKIPTGEKGVQAISASGFQPAIYRRMLFCGIVMLTISWLGLLLWTKAYGSVFAFIQGAAATRSGFGQIENPLAFMKYVADCIHIALYALLSAFLQRRPKGLPRIGHLFLIFAAAAGTFIYLLASDSRMDIALVGIAVTLITFRYTEPEKIKRNIVNMGVIGILLFLGIVASDSITSYVRLGEWDPPDFNILDNIVKEFKFDLFSEQNAMSLWIHGRLQPQLGNDLINSAISWLPDRFIPFQKPEEVWAYNTRELDVWEANCPSGVIATGILHCGLAGGLLLPVVLGYIIGVCDKRYKKGVSGNCTDAQFGVIVGACTMIPSHFQWYTFTLKMFPIFLYFLVNVVYRLLFGHRTESEEGPSIKRRRRLLSVPRWTRWRKEPRGIAGKRKDVQ